MVTINDKKISPTKKINDDVKMQIIYIPLESKMGYKYKENVRVMDYVCIGTVIGKSNVCDIPLISTVSGVVVGFQEKYISNGKKVKCVVIENDFKEKYLNKVGKKKDITKYSKNEYVYMLRENGITGLAGSDFPTYIKYDTDKKIKYLIVDGAECEVYASADGALMMNYAEEILEGIDAIMEIMGIEKAYIAINERNEGIIKKILKYIYTYPNIKVYSLPDAYPNGYERYLVSEILGLTYDRLPIEVGVINENVSTIYAIYEMLKYHKPLTERIVTLAGEGVKNPCNYKLKIGTNLSELLMKTNNFKKIKNPILIAGGAMMGKSIASDDFIITKDVNCVLLLEENQEKVYPCIKCGKCSEVCPVGIIPSKILDDPKRALDFKINKCVSCGLCSYVCPSKIEVRDEINKIRGNMK
ncbi:MAG: RnfABCDGE type electron transport complex subunit C [Erysipelotrichaceae bacterium]|nr:RnfABCDGE type electron transport complex subunit C [Erysipelotrichaceae bacterium]